MLPGARGLRETPQIRSPVETILQNHLRTRHGKQSPRGAGRKWAHATRSSTHVFQPDVNWPAPAHIGGRFLVPMLLHVFLRRSFHGSLEVDRTASRRAEMPQTASSRGLR